MSKNFVSWPLNFRTMRVAIRSTKASTTRSVFPGYTRPAENGPSSAGNPLNDFGRDTKCCEFPQTKNVIKHSKLEKKSLRYHF